MDEQVLDLAGAEAARRLIRGRKRPEDNVRQDLGRLLDAMETENVITYATPDGPADLYLPRRRTVIETKRVGDASEPGKPQARENNESPREQMERYLRSETERELGYLDLEGLDKRPWIGIVTDGQIWHAWRYAHEPGAVAQETLRARIDYGSNLSRQLEAEHDNDRRTLLYPKSSDIRRAARVAMHDEVANDTLYHWKAGGEDEAAYLVALLNAPVLSQAFLDSRQSGRDFHMHPWRKVPIPRFDEDDNDHVELARLTVQAERLIEQWISDEANTQGLKQVGLSKRIRRLLDDEGILGQIDGIARKLLPRQASA